MKYKDTLHPAMYELGQMEKYYSDMAAKGWHLKKRGAFMSQFVQGEPADIKYRVEVISPDRQGFTKMPEEQLSVYEDCGWEFVDSHSYIYIFRAPADSDTEEFYQDPAQQADTLKSLQKYMILEAIRVPFTLLLFTALNVLMGEKTLAQAYLAWIGQTTQMLGLLIFIIAFCIPGIRGSFHLWRLYSRMKNGIPLDHSPKKVSFMTNFIIIAMVSVGVFITFIYNPNHDYKLPAFSDGAYVTLADMGYEFPAENRMYTRTAGIEYHTSAYGEYWGVREELDDENVWMHQDVFVLKDEKRAEKVAKALMNTSTFARAEEKFSEMEFNGLDRVYYNSDLEIVVIKDGCVGYFTSIFTKESRIRLLTVLAEKWSNMPVEY